MAIEMRRNVSTYIFIVEMAILFLRASASTGIESVKPSAHIGNCGSREYFDVNRTKLKREHRRVRRVVGGRSSVEGEWPWHVFIREQKFFGTMTIYKCGGALISEKFILTAAHCKPAIASHLEVILGKYSMFQRNLPAIPVRRMVIHKDFNDETLYNDIALIELEEPIKLSRKISPICLPDKDDHFVGRSGFVSGWGRLYYKGDLPRFLQSVRVPIVPSPICEESLRMYRGDDPLPDSFLCAGHAKGKFDACEGDSGGPLAVKQKNGRWVLAGIVSHGYKCAEPDLFGVYMKTSFYLEWIDGIMNGNEADTRARPPQSFLSNMVGWMTEYAQTFSTKVDVL